MGFQKWDLYKIMALEWAAGEHFAADYHFLFCCGCPRDIFSIGLLELKVRDLAHSRT